MQTYHAKIDEEISTLVTTTQEHIDSQNQAIIACQNITEEAAKTEVVFLYFQNSFRKILNSYQPSRFRLVASKNIMIYWIMP